MHFYDRNKPMQYSLSKLNIACYTKTESPDFEFPH